MQKSIQSGIVKRMFSMLNKLRGVLKKKKNLKRSYMIKKDYTEKEYWEGKVPDELFDEYLNKYGYEYTPTDYHKIPSRY